MFFTDEMPKNCRECPCVDGEYGVCNIDCSVDLSADYRPKECPLQEVKHAHWIKNEARYYECSNCESLMPYDGIGVLKPEYATYWECDYCRVCGAKMDGKENEK